MNARTRAVAGAGRDQKRDSKQDISPLTLDDVLVNVRNALGVDHGDVSDASSSKNNSMMLWGCGENLGMRVRWTMRSDGGSFVEEAHGTELSYVSGHSYASENTSPVWETDFSGYTQVLSLDDREAALLSGWTRTNFWCSQEAQEVLDLELITPGRTSSDITIACRLKRNGLITSRVQIDAETFLPSSSTVKVCGDEERWTFEEWMSLDEAGGMSNGVSKQSDGNFRKQSGKNIYAGKACAMYPTFTTLTGSSGGVQTFKVMGTRSNSGVSKSFYRVPQFGETNDETKNSKNQNQKNTGGVSFLPNTPPEVVIERARSSHVLVRPLINGIDVGPFILDTGASGLVITKIAAEKLELKKFGEVFVSGVAGKVPCRFRRAESLTLGPVEIASPVFMEMALGGIVSGSADPVAGIVGFDAFKSAVLEVGPGGAPVRLYDPSTFVPDSNWKWHPLSLVSNVPHVHATFSGMEQGDGDGDDKTDNSTSMGKQSKSTPVVFMIDSGAGGADAIFHKRAVETLPGLQKLLPEGKENGASKVRGVGGSEGESSGATRAHRSTLEWLELVEESRGGGEKKNEKNSSKKQGGGYFEQLNVLLATDAGFDLSEHSVGLICANVLNKRRVVYDVPNRRVALLQDGIDEPPCESIMCAGKIEWENEFVGGAGDEDFLGPAKGKKGKKLKFTPPKVTPPTSKELDDFDECLRVSGNE